jgi:hypothetical protein
MSLVGAVPGWALGCLLLLGGARPLLGQDLEPADVQVGLDSALGIATKAARDAFPKLHDYLLYSITPRVLKADPGGLHWQVAWQERTFPHHRWLIVRVYMKDGRVSSEEVDNSTVPSRRAD